MNLIKAEFNGENIEKAIQEVSSELSTIKIVIKSKGFIYKIDKNHAIELLVKKAAKKYDVSVFSLFRFGIFEITNS